MPGTSSDTRFDRLHEQYEVLGEVDHWSNGLAVRHFRFDNIVFRLSFTERVRDEEPYTYLTVASHVSLPGLEHIREQKLPAWCPKYLPTFAGELVMDQAVQFLTSVKDAYFAGKDDGYAAAQTDFRKVIGL